MAVLSETVVVGGQLEQFDLSDHLKLLQADGRAGKGKRKGFNCQIFIVSELKDDF